MIQLYVYIFDCTGKVIERNSIEKGHGRKFIFTILKKCKNTSIFSYLWQKNLILHNFPDEKNNAYRIYIYACRSTFAHLIRK